MAAGAVLFSVDETSPALSALKRQEFHSLTAKLLYLAKRAMSDLRTVVSFLTTRVKAPTVFVFVSSSHTGVSYDGLLSSSGAKRVCCDAKACCHANECVAVVLP
jgi:hypothetical protein